MRAVQGITVRSTEINSALYRGKQCIMQWITVHAVQGMIVRITEYNSAQCTGDNSGPYRNNSAMHSG